MRCWNLAKSYDQGSSCDLLDQPHIKSWARYVQNDFPPKRRTAFQNEPNQTLYDTRQPISHSSSTLLNLSLPCLKFFLVFQPISFSIQFSSETMAKFPGLVCTYQILSRADSPNELPAKPSVSVVMTLLYTLSWAVGSSFRNEYTISTLSISVSVSIFISKYIYIYMYIYTYIYCSMYDDIYIYIYI